MDLNDIQKRIDRIYLSIDGRVDADTSKYFTHGYNEYGYAKGFAIKEPNEQQIHLLLIGIVHNVANLKDHLKKVLSVNGKQNIVEEAINNSRELQVLMDLNNADKHGYPLTKTRRSNLDPVMVQHHHILHAKAGSTLSGVITIEHFLDENQQLRRKQTSKITQCDFIAIASANIVDKDGNFITDFDTMISRSLDIWEEIIKNNNLLVRP